MRELLPQFAILNIRSVQKTVGNCSVSQDFFFLCLPCFYMSRNASSIFPLNKILVLEVSIPSSREYLSILILLTSFIMNGC